MLAILSGTRGCLAGLLRLGFLADLIALSRGGVSRQRRRYGSAE
jgi:hypothetical protein